MANLSSLGQSLGNAINNLGSYTAKAADTANAVSAQAQSAQGAFNQASADMANQINDQSVAAQYAYNSANMAAANEYNANAWQQAADYNMQMWEKAADFNREMWDKSAEWNEEMWLKNAKHNDLAAQEARDWQYRMDATKYRRAVDDMKRAGLNPILAVTGGGIGAGSLSGSTSSTGAASMGSSSISPTSMSSAQGFMASGGLLGANTASEGNYSGQMEYLSGTLGLISAFLGSLGSAAGVAGQLGDFGESLAETIGTILSNPKETVQTAKEQVKEYYEEGKTAEHNYRNGIDWNMKDYSGKSGYNTKKK